MKRTKALLAAVVCVCSLALAGCQDQTVKDNSAATSSTGNSVASTANVSVTSADSAESSVASEASASVPSNSSAENSLDDLWENAKYKEDTTVGEGAHNVKIEVKIGSKSVTLDVKSDKDNLADILTENELVEGETSAYGLYIKKVNGVSADYDIDGAYWGICKDGVPTPTGVSSITVKDGEHYELVYTLADAAQPAA